jgi:SAM-dependent methyltransferase
MRIATLPQNAKEFLGLTLGIIPAPLCDVLLGPLMANVLITASSVGFFDVLESQPLTSAEVAERCQTNPSATERVLRALYVSKYLHWSKGFYSLTRGSRRWLVSGAKRSIHHAVLHRKIDFRFFDFEQYVRTGEQREFHQELDTFEWIEYHRGQAAQAGLVAEELVKHVQVPKRARRMLDLGGGHGMYSRAFCAHHEGLRSRVLDLATPLQPSSASHAEPAGAPVAVTFEIADVRHADLGNAAVDVVLIANLMHHFDESTNRNLFQRVSRSLTSGGIVIAFDLVRAPSVDRSEQLDALLDVYFGASSGSQLWTVEQIRKWQTENGLCPLPPFSMRLLPACKVLIARKS